MLRLADFSVFFKTPAMPERVGMTETEPALRLARVFASGQALKLEGERE